jgi:hypothetical protein
MPLPHDFRAAAKLPIPANANGAPLQISGSKLQENFEYLDRKQVEIPEAGEIYHNWKVRAVTGIPGRWYAVGGTVYSQGAPINVDDIYGDAEPYVLLKITRDTDSREVTSAEIQFYQFLPESDSTNQYRVLAYVDSEGDNPVTQYQFEEIRIFEDLAVVNGEFQLVGLEMSHRNYYEPPV